MKTAPPASSPEAKPRATAGAKNSAHANSFWDEPPFKWIHSLRVGLVLLTILTIASVFGTLIGSLERAQELVFYSWWYKTLLLALAINMTGATLMTTFRRVLPARVMRVQTNKAFFDSVKPAATIPFRGGVEEAAEAFRRHGFVVHTKENAGAARRGWIGRFGAPISHLGLVIVLLAGFGSSWLAKEGVVQIREGGSAEQMQLRGKDKKVVPLGFTVTVEDFSTGFFPRTRIPSHFISTVKIERNGDVVYTGPVEVNHSPKVNGWRLHQTSYNELKGVARAELSIAGPGMAEPVALEMSPGQTRIIPGTKMPLHLASDLTWTITNDGETIASGVLKDGGTSHDSGNISIVADQFEPDFVIGADRKASSRTNELNNPALHVTLKSNGKKAASQWLFGREDMKDMFHSPDSHYKMELVDVQEAGGERAFVVEVSDAHTDGLIGRALLAVGEEVSIREAEEEEEEPAPAAAETSSGWQVDHVGTVPAYSTVISLSRNPTIPIIYAGCALMMAGLFIGFFIRRRNVWFLADEKAGQLRVAAMYRHQEDELDPATRAVLARLQQEQTP